MIATADPGCGDWCRQQRADLSVLSPGRIIVVDDIGSHGAFPTFARRNPQYQTIICLSADRAGIFGIAVNRPASSA